jgi:hypothetical protein
MPRECFDPSPPILVGAPCQGAVANAGGSIRKRRLAWMTDGTNGKERKSEAKRRQTQGSSAVPTGTAAPAAAGAHLSAFHRGPGLGDRTPLPGSSSALPELVPLSGRYPRTGQPQSSDASRRPVVVPVGRKTRSRPGAGCKSARGHRTRPAGPGLPPGPRPYGRGSALYVT